MLIIVLVLLTIVLVALEVIIPSGGIIGAAAGISGVVALVLSFSESSAIGWAVVAGLGAGTPLAIWLGFKILPHTPFVLGARIEGHAKKTGLESYRGRRAVALTPLKPSGLIRIDGARLDASSRGELIDSGAEVEVIEVRAGVLVVEPVDLAPPSSSKTQA